MKYPDTEPEIAALALRVIEGLKQLGAELPAPPVSADELEARLNRFNASKTRVVNASLALYDLIRVQNAHYGSLIRAAYGEPFMTQETVRVDDVVTMGVRSI